MPQLRFGLSKNHCWGATVTSGRCLDIPSLIVIFHGIKADGRNRTTRYNLVATLVPRCPHVFGDVLIISIRMFARGFPPEFSWFNPSSCRSRVSGSPSKLRCNRSHQFEFGPARSNDNPFGNDLGLCRKVVSRKYSNYWLLEWQYKKKPSRNLSSV